MLFSGDEISFHFSSNRDKIYFIELRYLMIIILFSKTAISVKIKMMGFWVVAKITQKKTLFVPVMRQGLNSF